MENHSVDSTTTSNDRLPKLLAIDDSELIHKILRVRLQHEQLEILSACSGEEGIRMAKELRPEVILLDIELGDMTGFDVLQKLKSDPETRDIAVMLISAFSESIDRVRGLDLGAVDFITKPFEVIELTARVRSILRLQSAMHMLAVKAQIDGLTGLWNRKYFDARLDSEFSEGLRHGRPLSLIMTDIDKFKSLNDGYGHPFGDLVLERFARILSGGRSSDVACRYGGEEFGIVLPSTTLSEAHEVAERLRERLATEHWPRHEDLRVTASFGVADLTCIASNAMPRALVEAADRALYAAKHGGRNRVELASPESLSIRKSA
ncbi:MAG: diguanylate cyclase [Phycisphaerae bacterium]|jgi:two-component system cell cycle response regulator|nr:diguanylate cyclase [Phycisphaerae bacterium]